jgi:hypothetical protein
MVNTSSSPYEKLAIWLHSLVEILRSQGGSTWTNLVSTIAGKTAVIDIDGIQLRLRANNSQPLKVDIDYPGQVESVNFRSDAETLRDMIAGRLTLDKAVATGQIHLRGTLSELLSIYKLAMDILADSAINPQLQRLWEEFDDMWSRPNSPPRPLSLEEQGTTHGELIINVPSDVLRIEVEPEEG